MAFRTKICCKITVASACTRILRSVNIWRSYRQGSWLSHALWAYTPAVGSGHYPAGDQELARYLKYMARNSCC